MIKFKIFTRHVECGYALRKLEEKVNNFLDTHEILDIKTNFNSEKVETWLACDMSNIISYTIKYKEADNKE